MAMQKAAATTAPPEIIFGITSCALSFFLPVVANTINAHTAVVINASHSICEIIPPRVSKQTYGICVLDTTKESER